MVTESPILQHSHYAIPTTITRLVNCFSEPHYNTAVVDKCSFFPFQDSPRLASCKHQHTANHSWLWCSRNRPHLGEARDDVELIKLNIFATMPKPCIRVSFAMQRQNWKQVNFSSLPFPTVEPSYEPVEDAFLSCQLCNAQSASFITILHTILLTILPRRMFLQSFLPYFLQSFLPFTYGRIIPFE